jgi:hypothetical protein
LKRNNNILICPLEWGLGHATRMIPLARILQEMNNNIFIGSGRDHLLLFRDELPGVSYIEFPGFRPGYSRLFPQYIPLLLKTPLLIYHIIREHYRLKKIIRDYDINVVISDNRFGLWNRKIKTVYVTHMPLIPFPKPLRIFEFIGIRMHRAIIKKYSFCFIPDLPGELNVSGRLSHGIKLPVNVRYTGILSRFISEESFSEENTGILHHNTVILSGPEPQKGILKQKLVTLLKDKIPMTVMFEGKPGMRVETAGPGNIIFYNHLPAPEMKEIIQGSEIIISRSGYTTIMELISLNRSAMLIPTPGQTEQEYLAEYLSEQGWFTFKKQRDLKDIVPPPAETSTWSGKITEQSRMLLTEALKEMLIEPHKES